MTIKLSITRLSHGEACPRSAAPLPPGSAEPEFQVEQHDARDLGILVHAAIALLLTENSTFASPTDEQMDLAIRTVDSFRPELHASAMQLMRRWRGLCSIELLGLTVRLVEREFRLDLDADTVFVGQFDAVLHKPDGTLVVAEWKTGKRGLAHQDQVALYALAARANEHSRAGVWVSIFELDATNVRREHLTPIRLEMEEQRFKIRAGRLLTLLNQDPIPTRPSFRCPGCRTLPICDAGQDYLRAASG